MNCYLLTGGRSVRMGRSKVDLFAPRIVSVARAVFDDVIAVQRDGTEMLRDVETLFDAPSETSAPVFGLIAALQHARAKCVVLAIDYPLMTADLLRFLRDRFTSSAAPLLVPEWDGRPQMLCAGYDSSLLATLEKRVAEGRLDLRGLLADGNAEMIPENELRARFGGEPLMNVNTPEELQEAERIHGRS